MTRKIAGLYIRTSTENQSESIKLQSKELEEYCSRYNIEIYNKYVDFGYSGKNADRPHFNVMLEDAKEHKFDVLLVTKIDRFARSVIDCLVNIELLGSYGVAFAATSQPIDTSSAMGKLTLQIMSAFAEFERSLITERMQTGRIAAEKRGVVCCRPKKDINIKKLHDAINKGLSANACAKLFGVSVSTITSRLLETGYTFTDNTWRKNE
jgi:site-specific DNA recombinase